MSLNPADRRADPRIEVDIPARLVAGDGREHPVTISNISRGGALVSIEAARVAELLPNVERELRHIPVCVRIEFRLPSPTGFAAVAVDCGIAHLRRTGADRCAMGLGYRNFHGDSAAALEVFCRG